MHFQLNITLGNASMQSPADVADALVSAARKVRSAGDWPAEGRVFDVNGNTVGTWFIEETS
jgi:hypothetical protein